MQKFWCKNITANNYPTSTRVTIFATQVFVIRIHKLEKKIFKNVQTTQFFLNILFLIFKTTLPRYIYK